jgi:hypothetical protein
MKRIAPALACIMILAAFLPVTALADVGPKPELTIRVVNAPAQLYYLDLLIQDPGSYDNLKNGDSAPYDQTLLAGLHSWEGEGWHPAYAGGTRVPLFGDLTGVSENGVMVHTFTYLGLPHTFRIAVSGADGTVQAVSEPFTRQVFRTTITYNYAKNAIVGVTPVWLSYAGQFFSTFIPTLIIEGLVLLLFGFKLRENRKFFVLLNLITQAGLTAVLGTALITSGPLLVYFYFLPAELAVTLAEALACSRFLKGYGKRRRVVYALCANAASAAFGIFTLWPLFSLLSGL